MILGGGLDTRPFEAARLFRVGLAPVLLVSNEEPGAAAELGIERSRCEITVDLLTRIERVPPENIVLLGGIGSTRSSEMASFGPRESNPQSGSSVFSDLGYLTSTFDEARALNKWLETNKADSIIIVTNPLHSQRVRWIFDKILERGPAGEERRTKVTIQLATIDCRKYTPLDWWQSEEGLIAFNNEWIKSAYYWFKY